MIVKNGVKMKKLYDGDVRICKVYHGDDLIYNCYAIPETETIWLMPSNNNLGDENILSNTDWKLS